MDNLLSATESSIRSTREGIQLYTGIRQVGRIVAEYGGFISSRHRNVLSPDKLWVEPNSRGRGYGEHLVRTVTSQARLLGVDTLAGHVESEFALAIRARIFGEKALHFYDDSDDGSQERCSALIEELPLSYEQAYASLQRAGQYEAQTGVDPDERKLGFIVHTEIRHSS